MSTTEVTEAVVESPPRFGNWRTFASRYSLVGVLLVMILVYSLLLPSTFPTFDNVRIITSTQAVLVIAALGVTITFATGEFDISFGPVIAFASTLLAALTVNHSWPFLIALVAVIAAAALIGLVNSFFIVFIGVSSLITTLGTGTIVLALTLAVSDSNVIAGPPQPLADFATSRLFGLPYPVYLALALTFAVWFMLQHTPAGRCIYFIGEGRQVATLSGIAVDRYRVGALVVTAVMCGIAGIINFGRLGSADPNLGMTYLLPGTAAVFLGATAIHPGRFNAWGTVLAVFVLVVGVTGIELLGGAGWLESLFNGTALVLAVTFAELFRRRDAT